MPSITLYGPFTQLLTLENLPLKGALNDKDLIICQEQGILVEDGIVKEIGAFEKLAGENPEAVRTFDDSSNMVALNLVAQLCWAMWERGSASRKLKSRMRKQAEPIKGIPQRSYEINKKFHGSSECSDLLCLLLLKEEDFLNSFGNISTSPSPCEGEGRWG